MKKQLNLILIIIICASCFNESRQDKEAVMIDEIKIIVIPDHQIEKSQLRYNKTNSSWTLDDQLFTGYAISLYPDKSLKEKLGIFKGKRQNLSEEWYPDGHLKFQTNYHQGKLHGSKKHWSSDPSHLLVSQLNYHLGKADGQQKKWYPTGEIFKILHLEMGKEQGLQQAFRKNGDLFANYEAKEGRIFGLKRASLCFDLEDEKMKDEK